LKIEQQDQYHLLPTKFAKYKVIMEVVEYKSKKVVLFKSELGNALEMVVSFDLKPQVVK